LIDQHALHKKLSVGHSNLALIPVLVPMFLILSSSIYPAIMSSMENKEASIIVDAAAQLKGKDTQIRNSDTSSHHATMPISKSHNVSPPYVAPMDISLPATSSSSMQSNKTLTIGDKGEGDGLIASAINTGTLVHVLWDDVTPGNDEVFYKRDGADFDPTTINLSNGPVPSFQPAIAAEGNNVHVVWTENNEILYKRSTDRGAAFTFSTINLSNNGGESVEPAIAVSGDNVHVVWRDNSDIFYKRSPNGGASFTEPTKNLSNNAGFSWRPTIAASGNNIHVAWSDNTPVNFDILYRRSINGGSTFPNIIKNLSSNVGQSLNPAIAVSGNNVHVVWDDDSLGNFDILYRRSLNSGETFPNVIMNLSDNALPSTFPSIAASGNNVHVVWQDETLAPTDILYRRSIDGGSSFTEPTENLSNNTGDSAFPAISVADNNVYVVWADGTPGPLEILYRPSTDNGVTFDPTATNLSASTGVSNTPSIAVS
jgi:hypothetical protein